MLLLAHTPTQGIVDHEALETLLNGGDYEYIDVEEEEVGSTDKARDN